MSENFDAFKTDLRLALLTLKEEVRVQVETASDRVLTEVRERLSRGDDERSNFYSQTRTDIRDIKDITMETRELARKTNGRVDNHEEILYGRDDDGGLVKGDRNNTNWRKAMVAAGGAWLGFLWLMWMVWGSEIQARGILNRPASDYVEFVDARIKQWLPDQPKPTVAPPNLAPKNKDGTLNPN